MADADREIASYDEGSWTPGLTFETPGDQDIVLGTAEGSYARWGRLVYVSFTVITSTFTHSTASGNLRVTGLPFSVGFQSGLGNAYMQGYVKTNVDSIIARANSTEAFITLRGSQSGGPILDFTASDFPSGGIVAIVGSIVYVAAS